MIVQLSRDEVRVCTLLATERWLAKYGSVDRPNYAEGKKNGYLEHELLANVRANVSEWAVASLTDTAWNVPWYPNELHPRRAKLPDVGVNFEVRTLRTRDSVPFWNKDEGKIIVGTKILDEDYYSQVEVYGWCNPAEYATSQYRDETISGWRVPVTELKEFK